MESEVLIAGSSTERNRRLRARRASGRMIIQAELSPADLDAVQRFSGKSALLTPAQVSEQMIAALHAAVRASQANKAIEKPRAFMGRGTWDDPLIPTRKPQV